MHQTPETRAAMASELQDIADRKVGPGKVAVKAGLAGNQWLLIAALPGGEEYLRNAAEKLSTPSQRAHLCVRGFSQVDFVVMNDRTHSRRIGGYTTDAFETMDWLKSHGTE
jgi:hypothetical protein